MIKRFKDFWDQLRGDKGRLLATVRVDFYPNRAAYSSLAWHDSVEQERDPVSLAVYLYARLLFELAELHETRVAQELMAFLSQVTELVLTEEGPPNRPRLPLGELTIPDQAPLEFPTRTYVAEFLKYPDGQMRINFQGSLGKEGVYLPAAYVVFLQTCLNILPDKSLRRLAQSLGRLHNYYKMRKDFWDSTSITAGPAFALGTGKLSPEAEEVVEESG